MGNKSKRNTKRARDKRHLKPTKPKPLQIATFDDGTPVCVMRPARPERAVELVKEAHERHSLGPGADTEWKALQEQINEECGPYTLVGFLALPGQKVVDKDCQVLGDLQPGDSFMHQSAFEEEG